MTDKVAGQRQVISRAARLLASEPTIANRHRPRAVLFFVGLPGVGKTSLAKALAETIYGTDAFFQLDLLEFSTDGPLSGMEQAKQRLLGFSPSFAGLGSAHTLGDFVQSKPESLVFLRNIGRAHPDLWPILLEVVTRGQLPGPRGTTTYFSQATVVLAETLPHRPAHEPEAAGGASSGSALATATGGVGGAWRSSADKRYRQLVSELLGLPGFPPELLSALSAPLIFSPLKKRDLLTILDRVVGEFLCPTQSSPSASIAKVEVVPGRHGRLYRVAHFGKSGSQLELLLHPGCLARLLSTATDLEGGAYPFIRAVRHKVLRATTVALLGSGELDDDLRLEVRLEQDTIVVAAPS